MAPTRPDIVLLVHGTFSYRDQDEPAEPAAPTAWWQDGSGVRSSHGRALRRPGYLLAAHDDAECRLPWTIGRLASSIARLETVRTGSLRDDRSG